MIRSIHVYFRVLSLEKAITTFSEKSLNANYVYISFSFDCCLVNLSCQLQELVLYSHV